MFERPTKAGNQEEEHSHFLVLLSRLFEAFASNTIFKDCNDVQNFHVEANAYN